MKTTTEQSSELGDIKLSVTPTHYEIIFGTRQRVMIPAYWYHQYPIFKGEYIDREYSRFEKYIYPTLCGSSLKCENVDSKMELGEIINELNAYGIKLTPKQVLDISQSSGLMKLITEISKYIDKCESCCCPKGSYKKKKAKFGKTWDEYIRLLSDRYQDTKFLQIDFKSLYTMLTETNCISTMPDVNFLYDNLIYEFLDWFKASVKKDKTDFYDMLQNLKAEITSSSFLQSSSTIVEAVGSLMSKFNIPEKARSRIDSALEGVSAMCNVLKGVGVEKGIPEPPPPPLSASPLLLTGMSPVARSIAPVPPPVRDSVSK